MLIIPTRAVPNQALRVQLAGQNCQINLYQKWTGLFVDVLLNNNYVVSGILALNLVPVIVNQYFGFVGDFTFFDNQGTNNPDYTGLGGRYSLVYLAQSDFAGF